MLLLAGWNTTVTMPCTIGHECSSFTSQFGSSMDVKHGSSQVNFQTTRIQPQMCFLLRMQQISYMAHKTNEEDLFQEWQIKNTAKNNQTQQPPFFYHAMRCEKKNKNRKDCPRSDSRWIWCSSRMSSSTMRPFCFDTKPVCVFLCLVGQDEGVDTWTVWGDGHGPAGLPDSGAVCGELVHQGAAGTNTSFWLSIQYRRCASL